MSVRILAFVLVAAAVYGNPVPQQASSSTLCPIFETYNPYLDQCVEFASVDSCGLLGVTCQSGEWCSNANNWSNPGQWGCCPEFTVFNDGVCAQYMNTFGGCGAQLQACPAGSEYCSVDLSLNGTTPSVDGQITAFPPAAGCCPDISQWEWSTASCITFNDNDSCGAGYQSCGFGDSCQMNNGATVQNDINNWSCQPFLNIENGNPANPYDDLP